jgi:hypothetical protein
MKDLQREILNQVSSGEITPAEGASRLEALGRDTAAVPEPPMAAMAVQALPEGSRTVKVISTLGSTEVVGDATVAYAVAEGPHRVRQDGDVMVIELGPAGGDGSFSFAGGGRFINGLEVQRRTMTIRMNPDLPLIALVQAGNVRVTGLHGPITAEVQAGNCKVEDFHGPLNALVQAGSVTARGCLDSGESKVRCEMGSIRINLEKGSSVRVTAHSTLGKVSIDGASGPTASVGETAQDVTVGAGAARLDIDCTMGNVRVVAD